MFYISRTSKTDSEHTVRMSTPELVQVAIKSRDTVRPGSVHAVHKAVHARGVSAYMPNALHEYLLFLESVEGKKEGKSPVR